MALCGNGVAGYKGKPYISKDGGTTFLVVTSSKDMSLNKTHAPIDVTSFDNIDGNKNFIEGTKEWSATVNEIYLQADAGQEAMFQGVEEGAEVIFQYRPNDKSGQIFFEGVALVKDWAMKSTMAEAVMVSASLQGCGKLQRKVLP